MKKPYRLGVLGLGNMGQKHLAKIALLEGVELGFIYDKHAEKTQKFEQRYQTQGVYDKAKLPEFFQTVEAIIIATPTTTHFDYIVLASDYVSKIFVEKPLTETLEQSQKILQLSQKKKLDLQIGFIERFNPVIEKLNSLIQSIPTPYIIQSDFTRAWRANPATQDVDVVLDLMIHDIDLALYLHGPIATLENAYGTLLNDKIEFASATLKHENGTFSRLIASKITDKPTRRVEITAQHAFYECDLLKKTLQIHDKSKKQEKIDFNNNAFNSDALYKQLRAFVQPILVGYHKTLAVAHLEDGLNSIKICQQIQDKIYTA